MDSPADASRFFNWEIVVFALGLYIVVFIFRRIVEGFWKKALANYYWSEVVLPILPPFVGAIFALVAVSFPYPDIVKTTGIRVMYGLGMGFFSGWAYRVFKALVKKFTGVDVDVVGNSTSASDPVSDPAKPPPADDKNLDVKKPGT